MTVETILFLVLAAAALGGAVNLIAQTHPIHSALSLIVVMVALAGIYLLLGAELLAAIQIIVYAGAIMVLFVFIIMLLNAGKEERTAISRAATWIGLPFGVILTAVLGWRMWLSQAPVYAGPGVDTVRATRELSQMLFTNYFFPFELTSILILVAILGAIVLAKRDF